MARYVSTALLIAAFWAPPLAALLANRLSPSLESALAVPYALIGGLALGTVATLAAALAARRWPAMQPGWALVIAAGLGCLILLPIADRGALSVVH